MHTTTNSAIVPTSIDDYQLEQQLGTGARGQLFRAKDLETNQRVSLRLLTTQSSIGQDAHEFFVRETESVKKILHPNIAQLRAAGTTPNGFYLVYEYLTLGSLRTLMRKNQDQAQGLPIAQALDLAIQTCHALEAAHNHGHQHGEIKPENLLLERLPRSDQTLGAPRFKVKLADLGLSRLLEGLMRGHLSHVTFAVAYNPPERFQGHPSSFQSDLYSLGIVLFETLTGRVPFEAASLGQAALNHLYTPPRHPKEFNPDIPTALDQIVMRLLAKRPEDRHSSAATLRYALQTVLETLPGPTNTPRSYDDIRSTAVQTKPALVLLQPPAPIPTPATRPFQVAKESAEATSRPTETTAAPALPLVTQPAPSTKHPSQEKPTPNLHLPTLTVSGPDMDTEHHLVDKHGLHVGRQRDNNVRLNHELVSRKHLHLAWTGEAVQITDLGSSNGTLLDKKRIPSNVPLEMPWNSVLYVYPYRFGLTAPGALPLRLGLEFERKQMQLVPGHEQSFVLRVKNHSPQSVEAKLNFSGVPETWINTPSSTLELRPNEERHCTFVVRVPKDATARQGEHLVSAHLQCLGTAQTETFGRATWNIQPYRQMALQCTPTRIATRNIASFELRLHNQGNAAERFAIQTSDHNQGLAFLSPLKHRFDLQAGQVLRLPMRVKVPTRIFGRPMLVPVTVFAIPQSQHPSLQTQVLIEHRSWFAASATGLAALTVGLWWLNTQPEKPRVLSGETLAALPETVLTQTSMATLAAPFDNQPSTAGTLQATPKMASKTPVVARPQAPRKAATTTPAASPNTKAASIKPAATRPVLGNPQPATLAHSKTPRPKPAIDAPAKTSAAPNKPAQAATKPNPAKPSAAKPKPEKSETDTTNTSAAPMQSVAPVVDWSGGAAATSLEDSPTPPVSQNDTAPAATTTAEIRPTVQRIEPLGAGLAEGVTLSGLYRHNYGLLELSQQGEVVRGEIITNDLRLPLQGTLVGTVLTGTYEILGISRAFVWNFSSDGTRFEGLEEASATWTGNKI